LKEQVNLIVAEKPLISRLQEVHSALG